MGTLQSLGERHRNLETLYQTPLTWGGEREGRIGRGRNLHN